MNRYIDGRKLEVQNEKDGELTVKSKMQNNVERMKISEWYGN